MASKSIEVMQYTETVYYDDDGNEVARVRNHDDTWYDTEVEGASVSKQEVEDYYNSEED